MVLEREKKALDLMKKYQNDSSSKVVGGLSLPNQGRLRKELLITKMFAQRPIQKRKNPNRRKSVDQRNDGVHQRLKEEDRFSLVSTRMRKFIATRPVRYEPKYLPRKPRDPSFDFWSWSQVRDFVDSLRSKGTPTDEMNSKLQAFKNQLMAEYTAEMHKIHLEYSFEVFGGRKLTKEEGVVEKSFNFRRFNSVGKYKSKALTFSGRKFKPMLSQEQKEQIEGKGEEKVMTINPIKGGPLAALGSANMDP